MLYAKIENDSIIQIGTLSALFPYTGFSSNTCSEEFKLEHNLMDVVQSIDFDENTHRLLIVPPYINNGKVYSVIAEAMSEEDAAIYHANKIEGMWHDIRLDRNARLVESDWTQLLDSQVDKAAWAVYRQQLRDITIQQDPLNITWPTKP